jgi:hypothetical protein
VGFIPHVTLAYVSKAAASLDPLPEPIPVEVDNLTLNAGSGRFLCSLRPPGYEMEQSETAYLALRPLRPAQTRR